MVVTATVALIFAATGVAYDLISRHYALARPAPS
jgi:hypothetical protein